MRRSEPGRNAAFMRPGPKVRIAEAAGPSSKLRYG